MHAQFLSRKRYFLLTYTGNKTFQKTVSFSHVHRRRVHRLSHPPTQQCPNILHISHIQKTEHFRKTVLFTRIYRRRIHRLSHPPSPTVSQHIIYITNTDAVSGSPISRVRASRVRDDKPAESGGHSCPSPSPHTHLHIHIHIHAHIRVSQDEVTNKSIIMGKHQLKS